MVNSFYRNDYRPFKKGESLPKISTTLDSVRAYQFEIQFFGLPPAIAGVQQDLTLAAKRISSISYGTDPITVNRINDTINYPGRATHETVSIDFDNLYLRRTTQALWEWFKTIYDPITGDATKLAAPGGAGNRTFKANRLRIIELDNTRTPHAAIELYGVYPKSVSFAEKNYNTNEFTTLSVDFSFDFMDYFNY
jgi:hypothetical protein